MIQEENVCPLCQCRGLDFGGEDMREGNFIYEWQCPNCGIKGEAVYELSFWKHDSLTNYEGNKVVLPKND